MSHLLTLPPIVSRLVATANEHYPVCVAPPPQYLGACNTEATPARASKHRSYGMRLACLLLAVSGLFRL